MKCLLVLCALLFIASNAFAQKGQFNGGGDEGAAPVTGTVPQVIQNPLTAIPNMNVALNTSTEIPTIKPHGVFTLPKITLATLLQWGDFGVNDYLLRFACLLDPCKEFLAGRVSLAGFQQLQAQCNAK